MRKERGNWKGWKGIPMAKRKNNKWEEKKKGKRSSYKGVEGIGTRLSLSLLSTTVYVVVSGCLPTALSVIKEAGRRTLVDH